MNTAYIVLSDRRYESPEHNKQKGLLGQFRYAALTNLLHAFPALPCGHDGDLRDRRLLSGYELQRLVYTCNIAQRTADPVRGQIDIPELQCQTINAPISDARGATHPRIESPSDGSRSSCRYLSFMKIRCYLKNLSSIAVEVRGIYCGWFHTLGWVLVSTDAVDSPHTSL